MGLEQNVKAFQGRSSFDGKLYLDSKSLTFRAKDLKWSCELCSVASVKVDGERMRIVVGREHIAFDIGKNAAKWSDKILNPPNRMKKLGVNPSQACWLSKGFKREFRDELKGHGAKITRQIGRSELAFWYVAHKGELVEFEELTRQLPAGNNIWIIWPKGSDDVGQTDVMTTAKSFGFGPSKTAAFDDNHSSMRFACRPKK